LLSLDKLELSKPLFKDFSETFLRRPTSKTPAIRRVFCYGYLQQMVILGYLCRLEALSLNNSRAQKDRLFDAVSAALRAAKTPHF